MSHPTVPGLFARRSINLLVGPSGSGKTHLALSQLDAYAQGLGFLGYPLPASEPPEQLGAIVATRTLEILFHDVQRMTTALPGAGVFPMHRWAPDENLTDLEALEQAYLALSNSISRPVRFLYIEGFQAIMTGRESHRLDVQRFYKGVRTLCAKHDVTILGTVGSAKTKRGEYYAVLAERIYGSVWWGHEADTVIAIEEVDVNLPSHLQTSVRRICTHCHGEARKTLYADFGAEGRLTLIEKPETQETPSYAQLDTFLDAEEPGREFRREVFMDWGEGLGISERTVERWIARCCREDLQLLVKVGNTRATVYKKPFAN